MLKRPRKLNSAEEVSSASKLTRNTMFLSSIPAKVHHCTTSDVVINISTHVSLFQSHFKKKNKLVVPVQEILYWFKKYCTGSKNIEPVQEQIVPKDKLNYNIHLIQKRLSSELLQCALHIVAYPDCKAPWM